MGEHENGFSFPYQKTQYPKTDFFLFTARNVYCVRSARSFEKSARKFPFYYRGTLLLDCKIERQQCLQSSDDHDGRKHVRC